MKRPTTGKCKSKQVENNEAIADQNEVFEPIVITGTFNYIITLNENEYTIDAGERSIQNDLCAILLAKDITEKVKTDMNIASKSGLDKKALVFINNRLNMLGKSYLSLKAIGEDILATMLAMVQKKD